MDDHPAFGLRHYECNGGTWQQWDHWPSPRLGDPDVWNIMSRGTWECLDYHPNFGLRTVTCNGGSWQEWLMYPLDDTWAAYVNVGTFEHFDGRLVCLDDSGPLGLRATDCNLLDFQQWSHW